MRFTADYYCINHGDSKSEMGHLPSRQEVCLLDDFTSTQIAHVSSIFFLLLECFLLSVYEFLKQEREDLPIDLHFARLRRCFHFSFDVFNSLVAIWISFLVDISAN